MKKSSKKNQHDLMKFKRSDIKRVKYGVLHSQIGFSDGVSIVIKQIENVMTNNIKIPEKNNYRY